MATAAPSGGAGQTPEAPPQGAVPFDLSQSPNLQGFRLVPATNDDTFGEKLVRKVKANPFVPLGCLGTAGALILGLRAFHQGKSRQSQLFMRGRIFAQGFTVVAIVVGVLATSLKPKE